MKSDNTAICVIGGGAAGAMAAIAAGKANKAQQVILIEQNEKIGKKLFITGKGRCNVTNHADMDVIFQNCITNPKFMFSAFHAFPNTEVEEFFKSNGCPLKVERGERVFPTSDHSSDIIGVLERVMKRQGVQIMLRKKAKELLVKADESGKRRIYGVRLADGTVLQAGAVIVATGGLSYSTTGSTGDGYEFARALDLKVVEPKPSLVPFETKDSWCKDLMGLALKNISLKMMVGNKCFYEDFGEMLFTHFGVSGPMVLSASCYYQRALKKVKNDEDVVLHIDLKPALDLEALDQRLLRDFKENQNKQFKNSLGDLFPSKLIPVMIELSNIPPEKKIHEISKEERRAFASLVKNLEIHVLGTRSIEEAIITQGGISVKEINPSTMECKQVEGLYFAGEVLDVDAMTGGYNLQIAWSSGYVAGTNAAEAIMERERN